MLKTEHIEAICWLAAVKVCRDYDGTVFLSSTGHYIDSVSEEDITVVDYELQEGGE